MPPDENGTNFDTPPVKEQTETSPDPTQPVLRVWPLHVPLHIDRQNPADGQDQKSSDFVVPDGKITVDSPKEVPICAPDTGNKQPSRYADPQGKGSLRKSLICRTTLLDWTYFELIIQIGRLCDCLSLSIQLLFEYILVNSKVRTITVVKFRLDNISHIVYYSGREAPSLGFGSVLLVFASRLSSHACACVIRTVPA